MPDRDTDPIDIESRRLARWIDACRHIGAPAGGLLEELHGLTTDPTRHRLQRCAKAARYAESVSTGEQKLIANAAAAELEDAATAP